MTPRVAEALTTLRNQAPPNYSGSVFGIRDTVKTAWRSALTEAKIEDFRLHDCRHTAITRMIQAGMPAAEVMKISGHTQWTTFARYVNINEQAARRGAELLSVYLGQAPPKAETVQQSAAVN
jgi:integrase